MRDMIWKKIVAAAFVLAVGSVIFGPLSVGQEVKKAKGRLPPYFADIVNDDQRQRIYDIQAGYAKTREMLEAQLESLRTREMAEIESVLTPVQRLALEKARTEGAAKRKKNAADKKAAEEFAKAFGAGRAPVPVKRASPASKPK